MSWQMLYEFIYAKHIALSSISGSFNICYRMSSLKKKGFVVKGILAMLYATSFIPLLTDSQGTLA